MKDFKPTKKLNKIRALLGLEVQLEQISLENGVVFEAESFEPGQPVFVLAEGERMPVPPGEFELPDGRVLVVVEEGVIAEMRSMEEAPEEQEAEMDAAPEAQARKVVEQVTKETHFSEEEIGKTGHPIIAYPTERIDALEAAVAELQAKLGVEKPVEEVQPEEVAVEASEESVEKTQEEVQPEEVELKSAKHSPEKWTKKVNTFDQRFSRPQTMHEKVMQKLFNN